jgi:hypothetical protein
MRVVTVAVVLRLLALGDATERSLSTPEAGLTRPGTAQLQCERPCSRSKCRVSAVNAVRTTREADWHSTRACMANTRVLHVLCTAACWAKSRRRHR